MACGSFTITTEVQKPAHENNDISRTPHLSSEPHTDPSDPAQPTTKPQPPAPSPTKTSVYLVFPCLVLAIFLVALDTTILSTAIPSITNTFQSLRDIGWYAGVYSLTTAIFQIIYGKLYTIFPHKWTFISGIIVFELGSVLCAAATSSTMLIVGRALAGMGGSGIFAGAFVMMGELIPLRWRPIANAAFGAIFGVASVVGPVLGGVLTDKLSWRWCFWINLPAGAVTVVIVMFLLKPKEGAREKASTKALAEQLNLPSMMILTGSTVSLLLALQWGGAKYRWENGRIIALFCVACLSAAAFVFAQIRQKDKAFVPVHILKQRTVWACCWYAFMIGATAAILGNYLPVWFQSVQGVDALQSGLLTLPFVFSLIGGSLVAGVVTSWIGYYAPPMILSCVLRAIGAGLLSSMTPETRTWQYVLYQIVFGLGDGIGMQQPMVAVQTVVPKEDMPLGLSVLMFCQIMGGTIFVVVGQSVFSDRLVVLLKSKLPQLDPEAIVDAGATAFRGLKLGEDALEGVVAAFSGAITGTFVIGVALSVVSLAGALAVEWKSVKKGEGEETRNSTDQNVNASGREEHELGTIGRRLGRSSVSS